MDRNWKKLKAEIGHSFSKFTTKEWVAFSTYLLKAPPKVTLRRSKNFGALILNSAGLITEEVGHAKSGNYREVLAQRGKWINSSVKSFPGRASKAAKFLYSLRASDMPDLIAFAVVFYVFGGARDGGLPDLDWKVFGEHRTIKTHSIILPIILESILLTSICYYELIYRNLPEEHDIIWDKLRVLQLRLSKAAMSGADLGMATHLFSDLFVDGWTPYKDLPGSYSNATHEVIMGLNSLDSFLEGYDKNLNLNKGAKDIVQKTKDIWNKSSELVKNGVQSQKSIFDALFKSDNVPNEP